LCIENTKEQLPDMNFCHPLQENISSFRGAAAPQTPCLQVLFFWLRHWSQLNIFTVFLFSITLCFYKCAIVLKTTSLTLQALYLFVWMGAVAEEWDVRSKRKLDNFLYDFLCLLQFSL
jgi:hypothetical protein